MAYHQIEAGADEKHYYFAWPYRLFSSDLVGDTGYDIIEKSLGPLYSRCSRSSRNVQRKFCPDVLYCSTCPLANLKSRCANPDTLRKLCQPDCTRVLPDTERYQRGRPRAMRSKYWTRLMPTNRRLSVHR